MSDSRTYRQEGEPTLRQGLGNMKGAVAGLALVDATGRTAPIPREGLRPPRWSLPKIASEAPVARKSAVPVMSSGR